MALVLEPALLPLLLTGALMIGLAVLLLVLDFNNLLHRVFALMLVFQGLRYFVGIIRASSDAGLRTFYTELFPYVYLPVVPLTILFACLYPIRRTWLGRSPWAPWTMAAITAGLMLWYMLDHNAYGVIASKPEGWLSTASGQAYVEFGPLFLIASLRRMLPGALALFLAWDYWRHPKGSGGFSRFLVYAGFALTALYTGTGGTWDLVYTLRNSTDFPWGPYGWSQWVMPVLGLVPALVSLVFIWKASKGEADDPTLQEPRRFVRYIAPVAVLSAIFLYNPNYEGQLVDFLLFAFGLWAISIPLLVSYALVRYQVFGADIAVKKSIAKAMMVVVLSIVFFLLLEAAESMVGDGGDLWVGMGAAAVLALAATPLQNMANHAAARIMPETKDFSTMDPHARGVFYTEQYHLVVEDGDLSSKDRGMLDRLALTLSLTDSQQKALEAGRNTLPRGLQAASEEAKKSSKWSRASTVGLLALVFGALSQGLESLIPADSFGFSLLAAAFVTLAIGPVQVGVDRLLEPAAVRQKRRRSKSTYWQAAVHAMADGNMTAKEKRYLDRLQQELGLSAIDRRRMDVRAARQAP